MPDDAAPQPLWRGRTVALLGILLVAVNLRTAVVAISPIVGLVERDIPLGSGALGLLGSIPLIAFALSGFVAPPVARRLGLENSLILACLAMVAGPLVRACAPNYPVLIVGTVLCVAGMGFGNILLPPAVKRYFPDRIGAVTAGYATLLGLGSAIPAVIATPVADAAGWRVSVAVWAVFALTALVPWVAIRLRRAAPRDHAVLPEPAPDVLRSIWRSRTAWTLGLTFAVSALNVYAMFAWLPLLVVDLAGVSDLEAGALLALFGAISLPAAFVVPRIAARVRNVTAIVIVGVAFFVASYLGLLLVPGTVTWLWVAFADVSVLFPLCLALIGLRTRSAGASVALSGFVQGVGYGGGAIGPLVLGVLHGATGSWTVPLLFLLGVSVLALLSCVVLARPSFVEDEIAAAHTRRLGQ